MKAFVVPDEGYINQAVLSLCSFFKYNHMISSFMRRKVLT